MKGGEPSRTALGAAGHRAAHQVLEGGAIFADPLAVRILGSAAEEIIRTAEEDESRLRLRLFIAVRTRFAEDSLAAAVAGGTSQLVVLGAGLDTYAYRSAFGPRLRIFEVDHPATQAWKRERLAEAGIAVPGSLTFVPADLERETLRDRLAASGFDMGERTFFTWLGVVPYLSEGAVLLTLGFMAGLRGGASVVFDYANPPLPGPDQSGYAAAVDALAARVAALGESLRCFFETDGIHSKLTAVGFREIEDLGPVAIRARYLGGGSGSGSDRGGHVVRASTDQEGRTLQP